MSTQARAAGTDARQVQLLARVLLRELDVLRSTWLGSYSALPTAVHPLLPLLAQALSPLLLALSAGRASDVQLHVSALIGELHASGLALADTLDVMRAFEVAVNKAVPDPKWRDVVEQLGRTLSHQVAATYALPDAERHLDSGLRLRPPPAGKSADPNSLLPDFVGGSAAMQAVFAQIAGVACAPGPVLITGESGTGKELVARALHRLGGHESAPFAAVNCAALPHDLIESELFGHEKGAFTGSRGSVPGIMRSAGNGTLFLDEITEMPLATQPKLLRALEQKSVRPVGGMREAPVHARVIAATNRDPSEAVRHGTLRADLFYRLSAHRIELPRLSERLEDLPCLLAHFVAELRDQGHRVPAEFSATSLHELSRYSWPGNVRELRNVVEHCCAAAPDILVEPRHLPRHIRMCDSATFEPTLSHAPNRTASEDLEVAPLSEIERRHIRMALRRACGNKAQAARMLALSRHQLYLKLERLGIHDW
ncbi:MAG: sigma-54 dependent transcriptional regulator [Myxococcales bacterium]